MKTASLGWTDYLVIIIAMSINVAIGFFYRFSGGHQKTTTEYFSADKSMSLFTVSIALMVSFISSITLLGVSAENYTYGTQFVVINLAYLIGTPIVCYCFLPVFFNLGSISAYEYLNKRFGHGAHLTAIFIYWIQMLLYSGVVLYAPALALETTTGMSKILSIFSIGVICALYSTIGGIKAVLISDVFQGILMFISLFIVIFTAAYKAGGFINIWRIASNGERIEFDNISIDPTIRHTWWGLIIGGLFTYLSLYGVNQVQVQRLLTLRNLKSARIALWLSWPILTSLSLLTCFSGLAIYSNYYNCDPKASKRIYSSDMLMPFYVMDTLSNLPGIPGLFVAGIFSAGLSTVSAALNSLAAITLEDFCKPMYLWYSGNELSESKSMVFSKTLVIIFGVTCIALAFSAQLLGGILQASLSIFGVVGGPLLGIFTLGMLTETTNQTGAVTGVLISLAFMLWIAFGQPRPALPTLPVSVEGCNTTFFKSLNTSIPVIESQINNRNNSSIFYLYRISYIWYTLLGFIVTILIGITVSYLTRIIFNDFRNNIDPDLFFPFVAKRIRKRKSNQSLPNNSLNMTHL